MKDLVAAAWDELKHRLRPRAAGSVAARARRYLAEGRTEAALLCLKAAAGTAVDEPSRALLTALALARRDAALPPRYEVHDQLGAGAMGAVHRAWDRRLERWVAVKRLTAAAGPDARARFVREVRALGALAHPRVVRLLDADAAAPAPYLVMELLEGRTLVSAPAGPGVLVELLEALAHVHSRGYLHRDVKPSNVFLRAQGGATLIDFGVARALDASELTGPGVAPGTLRYLAPELVAGAPATPRSDLFAAALVGIEAVFGLDVHAGDGAELHSTRRLSSLMCGVYHEVATRALQRHGRLAQVLLRAIHPDPARRPGSAAQLAAEVAAAQAPGGFNP